MTRRAFTLIEVFLAVALVGALLGTLMVFQHRLGTTREQARILSQQQRAADMLIDRLERDLLTTLVGDSLSGAGVAGDDHSIRILSRGVDASRAQQGRTDAAPFRDLQRSEYTFAAGAVTGLHTSVGATANGAEAGELWLLGELPVVRFRYHDGEAWRDSFDSLSADRLPAAVEVAIWFTPWPALVEPQSEEDDDLASLDDPVAAESGAAEWDDESFEEEPGDSFLDEDTFIPPPDRVRVMTVPDADPEEEEEPAELDRASPDGVEP